jgi:hypothetical protein
LYAYFNNVGDQRLQQLRNVGPGSVNLSTFNYTYDAEGQIATWGQTLGRLLPRAIRSATTSRAN